LSYDKEAVVVGIYVNFKKQGTTDSSNIIGSNRSILIGTRYSTLEEV